MIAELIRANSDVMRRMATVPLQHPGLAAEELEYAVNELGLSAVEIGTSVFEGATEAPDVKQRILSENAEAKISFKQGDANAAV